MVPNKDIYADKDGKVTDDPEKYAIQVAVAGHELDERTAKRYGIADTLVSTDEPNARRNVRAHNEASVRIEKADEKEAAAEEKAADKPETDEQEAEKPKAAASKTAAAKEQGAKKK